MAFRESNLGRAFLAVQGPVVLLLFTSMSVPSEGSSFIQEVDWDRGLWGLTSVSLRLLSET